MKFTKSYLVLGAILALASWLRWMGIEWGIPGGEHLVASYRSDEYSLFAWLRQMSPAEGDFNPNIYWNGTLLVFILAGFFKFFSLLGFLHISSSPEFYYQQVSEWGKFFLFGRSLMVGIGVLTVWAIYRAGREGFGKKVGLVAALLYAVSPLHVVSSKHLLVEPVATLWFSGMLFFCFRIIQKGLWRDYLGAAFILSSTTVLKMTFAPLWFLLLFSHLGNSIGEPKPTFLWRGLASKKLWGSTLLAAGLYFVFNPYLIPALIVNFKEVQFEFTECLRQYRSWSYLHYGWLFSLTHLLPYGFGLGFAVWGFLAAFFSLFSRRREVWLTLFGLLLYFYLNARTGTVVVKYSVVLLPFMILLIAYFFTQLMERTAVAIRMITLLFFGWMVLETLALSLSYNRLFLKPDARDLASRWINEHIPQGARIAIFLEPYWYSPPVLYNQYFFSGRSRYWREAPKYELVNLENDEKRIRAERPDYVVISERENRVFQRSRGDFRKADDWGYLESFLEEEGYQKIQTFDNSLERGGVKLPRDFPPDDWQQILLEIRIYRRIGVS